MGLCWRLFFSDFKSLSLRVIDCVLAPMSYFLRQIEFEDIGRFIQKELHNVDSWVILVLLENELVVRDIPV